MQKVYYLAMWKCNEIVTSARKQSLRRVGVVVSVVIFTRATAGRSLERALGHLGKSGVAANNHRELKG